MVTRCCVIGCKNYSHDRKGKRLDNGVQFFSIPTWRQHHEQQISELTKRHRMAWVSAVKQPDITINSVAKHFVCSRHFLTGKPADEMLDSDTDWSPTLHLGHTEVKASLCDTERSNQSTRRLQEVNNTTSAEPAPQRPEVDEAVPQPPSTTCAESDDASEVVEAGPEVHNPEEEQEFNSCSLGRKDINRLLEDYRTVKKNLNQKQFDEQYFKDNDERVKYYTGLPSFAMLMTVLSAVGQFLEADRKLSKFQKLVLTLMRLRLDWPNVHLAHMFRIDPKTAAITFKNTIDVIFFSELRHCVFWAERKFIHDSMPQQFEEVLGKRYAIIIDCFEIATERPAQPFQQRTTHAHTQKYLMCIAPFGIVTYVSKGCAGVVDDMSVALTCGLLQRLQKGDLVFADRGFNIKESAAMMCTEVTAPNTKGQCHLDDVEQTEKIARLRIPVRRLVENVRNKFTMLSHTIPACFCLPCEDEDCTWLDKIVRVCCILTQMWTCHNSLLSHDLYLEPRS